MQELEYGKGWVRDSLDPRDMLFAAQPETLANLPTNVDLGPFPPIYDQGRTGSCTAQAGAAVFDYARKRQGFEFMSPSKLFLYYATRLLEGSTESDSGAQLRDVIKALRTYGVCEEIIWPFNETMVTRRPDQKAWDLATEDMVVRYRSVQQTPEQIMGCLAEGYGIIFGFLVFDQYQRLGDTALVSMPGVGDRPLGGHANVLRGYSTIGGRVRVRARNSWGTGWGSQGECWFPMEFLTSRQICADFWAVEVVRDTTPIPVPPTPPPTPTPLPPYVGPGIKRAMDAEGDVPASAEWYPLENGQDRGFSMAFGRSGKQYIYVIETGKVTVTMPVNIL